MSIRIKNWSQFQHFKDRRPPWVKLYRDLLDDMDWHELDPKAAKALVMLWLIASESEGQLPEVKKLSFRLRLSEKETTDILSKLGHWLETDSDIKPISPRYQSDAPETEGETETEKRQNVRDGFDDFWNAYPKRKSRGQAEKTWDKLKPDSETVKAMLRSLAVAKQSKSWREDEGRFIPHPATWLNAKGWMDDAPVKSDGVAWWVLDGYGSEAEALAAKEAA